MFDKISIKDFVLKSNIINGDIAVATYKLGTLVSAGEGGNRHLYLLDREITQQEKNQFKYRAPVDALHVWFDTHVSRRGVDGFIFIHSNTPEEFLHHGRESSFDSRYYTWEEFTHAVEEVINRLK